MKLSQKQSDIEFMYSVQLNASVCAFVQRKNR